MPGALRHLRPVFVLFAEKADGHRRLLLLAGIALAAVTVLAGVALLGLSGWFITATAIAGLSTATALMFDVFAPAAGIRFLALARTVARYGERLATHDATLAVLAALREKLFRGFARTGEARRLAGRPALLLFRLTGDVDALDSLYLRVLVPLAAALVAALLAGLAVGLAYPAAGVALVVALLLAGIGIPTAMARAAEKTSRRRSHALEALRARAIDLSAGQTELLMVGRVAAQIDHIAHSERRLADADDSLNRLDTVAGMAFGTASTLILTGMLLTVAVLLEQGAIGAPVAAFMLMVSLAALEPFAALRRGALELGRTLLSARRLGGQLEVRAEPVPRAEPPPGLAVALKGVSVFHEGADRPVLDGVTLDIGEGEAVALVGASGAGKSTLLAVIAGEIVPRSGCVVARQHAMLTQRTELFQDSVRENLLLAKPDADDAALWQALAAAGLADDIRACPQGLDTPLGEGGSGLSGGQSRRLALARLLLRQTPLWLVDEASESLDAATARDVLARLSHAASASRRSLVIATHLRREAETADRIVLIERGRVVATARREDPAFSELLGRLRPD